MYIDTHTHITTEDIKAYQNDLDEAKRLGVEKIILVATDVEERKNVLSYKSDFVEVAYGIYPSDKQEIDKVGLDELEKLMQDNTFIALGEIGLDYHWYPDNKEVQREMFKKQIEIANRTNKPIIVHTRNAWQDTLDILKATPNRRKGIIHCFTGSVEMAKEFTKLGYYLGFGGVLTFKNARHPKEAIKAMDLKYLLFETDAPYLAPEPNRGKTNRTYYVKNVYEYAAELLEIDLEQLCLLVRENYQRLFNVED